MQQFTHCIKAHKLKGRLKLSDNSLTVVVFKFLVGDPLKKLLTSYFVLSFTLVGGRATVPCLTASTWQTTISGAIFRRKSLLLFR